MQSFDPTVLIRIRHPNIDPAVITDAFGIEPEYSWKAGEARPGRTEVTRQESYWVAQVPLLHSFPSEGEDNRVSFRVRRRLSPFSVYETGSKQTDEDPAYTDHASLEQVLMMAALLFKLRKEFWTKLRAEGGTAQLIVILGDPLVGIDLPHEVMSMLSESSLSLSVSFGDVEEVAA